MAGDTTALSERYPASRRSRVIAVVGVMALLAIPASTFAAKGGGSTAPWISLASVGGQSLAATAEPRVGSAVKFSSGYPTATKNPWVSLTCFQEGQLVYGEGGKPGAEFVLGGATSDWAATGGAASCRAELGDLYWKGGKQFYTYLAHTNFGAGG